MEALDGGSPSHSDEMTGRTSEASRLISQNTAAKPNYFNILSYISVLLFCGIITYCCFSKNGVSLFTFHPIFMSIGWLVLMTVAINAITPGDLATEWMPIRLRSARHWVLQLFGGIIILVGFFVILSNKIVNGSSHFTSIHGKFGLSSLVLMCGTMLGGLGALYSLKLKYYLAPIYTKVIHALAGLVTYSLGIVTIILGLFSNWFSFGETLRYISLVLILIIVLSTVLRPTLKVYFRLRERLDTVK